MSLKRSNKIIFALVALVVALGLFSLAFRDAKAPEKPEDDQGARYVAPADWETYTGPNGVTFKYPTTIGGTYLRGVDWPPSVQVLKEQLSCDEAGKTTERAGQTEQKQISGEDYCVTQIKEGAAGTTYDEYAYAREISGRTVILTFTTRTPQCGNYEEPERAACETEVSAFKPDLLMGEVFDTLTLP